MRSRLLATFAVVALAVIVTLSTAGAQMQLPALKRQPLHGTPVICGRKISQFILLTSVDFTPNDHFSTDWIHGYPKGLFEPVSEDAEGIFYQAINRVIVGRPYPPFEHELTSGGIYVSKKEPGNAYGYVGDARQPQEYITFMSARLPKPALEKFRIATPASPGKK